MSTQDTILHQLLAAREHAVAGVPETAGSAVVWHRSTIPPSGGTTSDPTPIARTASRSTAASRIPHLLCGQRISGFKGNPRMAGAVGDGISARCQTNEIREYL